MGTTSVYFDVPPAIEAGLSSGELVRIGGVVRNAETGEIVSHLAEVGRSGARDRSFELAHSLLVKSGMESNTASDLLNAAIPMLDFAMTGFHLYTGIMRVRHLEKAINRVYDQIALEFRREREVHLNMALEVAQNFNDMASRNGKEANIIPVDSDLSTALERVYGDIERRLEENMKTLKHGRRFRVRSRPFQSKEKWVETQLEIQQHTIRLILLGMHIIKLGSRCWLEIDEIDNARRKITSNIGRLEQLYEELVEQLRLTEKARSSQLDRSALAFAIPAIPLAIPLVTPVTIPIAAGAGGALGVASSLRKFFRKGENESADKLLHSANEDFVRVAEALQQLRGFDYELAAVKRLGVSFRQREQDIESEFSSRTTSEQTHILIVDDEAISRLNPQAS